MAGEFLDYEIATQEARGRAQQREQDRQGRLRNKLVEVIQGHPDESIRDKARQRLSQLLESGDIERVDIQAPRLGLDGFWRTDTTGRRAPSGEATHDDDPSKPLWSNIYSKGIENPSLGDRIDSSIGHMLLNAPKRRQAIAEFDRGLTGGNVTKFGNWLGQKIGLDDSMSPEAMKRYAEEAPMSASEKTALNIAGILTPGSVSRAAGGVAEKALLNAPKVAELAAKAPRLVSAITGAAGASAGGGAHEVAKSVAEGQTLEETGKRAWDAITDPIALILGGGLGFTFGAGARARARNKDVQLIESRGGEVGPLTAGKGGALDDALVAQGFDDAGKVTEEGIGRVSRASAKETAEAIGKREKAIKAEYARGMKAAAESTDSVDVSDIYEQAMRLTNDVELPRNIRAQIKSEIVDDFINTRGQLADDGAILMSPKNANALKKKLQKYFDEDAPALASEAKRVVDETAYGGANAAFHRGASEIEEARAALGLKPKFEAEVTPEQERTLANFLMRRGQDTRSAGKDITPELETALQRYPELRRLIEAPELLQARGRLEFGLGGEGVGGLRDWLRSTLGRNIDPATVRVIAPLLMGTGRQAPVANPLFDLLTGAAVNRRQNEGRKGN